MNTLYVDRKNIELRIKGGALEFHQPDGKRGSVPVAQLERVVLRGRVNFSTSVLGALTEAGVGVLSLSGRHNRHLATCVGRPHNDVVRRFGQLGSYLDPVFRVEWSRKIVVSKLQTQRRLLQRALEKRADKRFALTRATRQIDRLLKQLLEPDESMSVARIRGLEGAAASAYFSGFCTLFPPSMNFTGRNRRPPRDPVNACLSLGYTMAHFEVVMSCHEAGLDPLVGLFHEPAYGRESLASDIMEPLRAHIDEWVWELFRARVFDANSFNRDNDAVLLGKQARHRFYTRYQSLGAALKRMLRIQLRHVVREFEMRGSDTLTHAPT